MGFGDFQRMTFSNLGCEVHYWHKKGTRNDYVILLHGAGCDHLMFEKQAGIFESGYNVIAWDARGHGLSRLENRKFSFDDMYSDCLALFSIHNIEKAIVIGQSMGGNLAQNIAYSRPELVSKLVLIGCTKNNQALTAVEKISLKLAGFIFACYPWKALIRQSVNACGTTEYTKAYAKQCFERIEKGDFIEIMMSLLASLREGGAHTLSQPVLLICGSNDRTGNIKKAMKRWAKEENRQLRMIENAGHNANQDDPHEVNKHIALFIANISFPAANS
ncbi:MAG: alpha/beta hydrolase [Treponema sp.]|nr:alpha/beta hydrolase [Treponema sp.]